MRSRIPFLSAAPGPAASGWPSLRRLAPLLAPGLVAALGLEGELTPLISTRHAHMTEPGEIERAALTEDGEVELMCRMVDEVAACIKNGIRATKGGRVLWELEDHAGPGAN